MIPAKCVLNLSLSPKIEENDILVDESLHFISGADTNSDSKLKFFKEIPSFNKNMFSFVPHLNFVHNLYIYPQSLVGTSGRNIAVQVSILDIDDPQAVPLGVW